MKREESTTCKACGMKARYICSNRNEHGPVTEIDTFRCPRCGLVFVANALTDENLARAYATLDPAAYHEAVHAGTLKKLNWAADSLARMGAVTSTSILDIGGGLGEFGILLHERGYSNLSVHELPGSNLGKLDAQGITVYQDHDCSTLPSQAFDIITLLDVAEHVRDPQMLVQQCFRALKPGGRVYLHTPFVTGLDRVMHWVASLPLVGKVGKLWQRGRTSIFHLQNYTSASLTHILGSQGFKGIEIQRRNELSWPLEMYIRIFLCEKQGIPKAFVPLLALLLRPILCNNVINANKGIAIASKLSN